MQKLISILFLVFPLLILGQERKSISKSTFTLKKDDIEYVSKVDSIKNKISLREDVFNTNNHKDVFFTNTVLKDLNKLFETKLFSDVVKVNQLEFSFSEGFDEDISMHILANFTIQEWVFDNEEKVNKVYNYLLSFDKKGNTFRKVPVNWFWLKNDNMIYFFDSISFRKQDKLYQEIIDIVRNVIE